MDLTKAKSVQEKLNHQNQNNRIPLKSSRRVLDLENKNDKLIKLVQKVVGENKSLTHQNSILISQLGILNDLNSKLTSVVKYLQDKIDKSNQFSKVAAFFSAMLLPNYKNICSHFLCQKFLSNVMKGLKKLEATDSDDDPESKTPFFEEITKNYSMFYTIWEFLIWKFKQWIIKSI